MQKKMALVVLCIAQMTCVAMNSTEKKCSEILKRNSSNETQTYDLIMEERDVKAMELLAASHALDTCSKIKKFNGSYLHYRLNFKFRVMESEFRKDLDGQW